MWVFDEFYMLPNSVHSSVDNAAGFCSRQYPRAETPIANVRDELYNQKLQVWFLIPLRKDSLSVNLFDLLCPHLESSYCLPCSSYHSQHDCRL